MTTIKKTMKKTIIKIAWKISPFIFININYFRFWKKFPNLNKPKNLSEIILSTIYTGKVNEYSDFVDKIKVREYYSKWGYEEYLPKVFGIWNNTDEINFNELPESFALKTNHGCGSHYICPNKKDLNITRAKRIIDTALSEKYGDIETQYKPIKPLVYCEEFIDDGTGEPPIDYKIMCVGGKVKSVLIVTDRTDEGFKLITYDSKWKKLDYISSNFRSKNDVPVPKNLEIMLKIAQEISINFEFVRVDFFDAQDKLFIGELTFTPWGGNVIYFNSLGLNEMGH